MVDCKTPINCGTFCSAGIHAIVAVVMCAGLFGPSLDQSSMWLIGIGAGISAFIVDWFVPRTNWGLYTNDAGGFGSQTLVAAGLHAGIVMAIVYIFEGSFLLAPANLITLFLAIGATSILVDFIFPRIQFTAA